MADQYQVTICHIVVLICFLTARTQGYLQNDIEDPPEPRIFKIVERNNKVFLERDTADNYNRNYLLKFLKNNADIEYRVNNILNNNPIHLKETMGKKKRLIKRIVPHGLDTRDLQYDHRFKTYFKPLVRLHKTKLLNGQPQLNVKIRNQPINERPKKEKLNTKYDMISPLGKTYSSSQLLSPFNWQDIHEKREKSRVKQGTVQAISQLKYAELLINKLKHPLLKARLQDIFDNTLDQISTLYKQVHSYSSLQLRGGYAHEAPPVTAPPSLLPSDMKNAITLMPGMFVDPPSEDQRPDTRPLFPHLPIWNYWTYHNTIHQDECPGDQIKIGPICSRVPPHRRKQ